MVEVEVDEVAAGKVASFISLFHSIDESSPSVKPEQLRCGEYTAPNSFTPEREVVSELEEEAMKYQDLGTEKFVWFLGINHYTYP